MNREGPAAEQTMSGIAKAIIELYYGIIWLSHMFPRSISHQLIFTNPIHSPCLKRALIHPVPTFICHMKSEGRSLRNLAISSTRSLIFDMCSPSPRPVCVRAQSWRKQPTQIGEPQKTTAATYFAYRWNYACGSTTTTSAQPRLAFLPGPATSHANGREMRRAKRTLAAL